MFCCCCIPHHTPFLRARPRQVCCLNPSFRQQPNTRIKNCICAKHVIMSACFWLFLLFFCVYLFRFHAAAASTSHSPSAQRCICSFYCIYYYKFLAFIASVFAFVDISSTSSASVLLRYFFYYLLARRVDCWFRFWFLALPAVLIVVSRRVIVLNNERHHHHRHHHFIAVTQFC